MIMLHYAYMLYIFRLFYAFCDWFWNKNIIPAHNKAATKMSERRTALREADQDDKCNMIIVVLFTPYCIHCLTL